MKKIAIYFLIALAFLAVGKSSPTAFASSLPTQVRVIHTVARVFDSPDGLTGLTNEELSPRTIKFLYLGDIAEVVSEETEFYVITVEVDSTPTNGYIFKSVVVDNAIKSPIKFLETNGEIKQTTNSYSLQNDEFIKDEQHTISTGTRVRILSGYSNKREFTQISFEKNGTITTTYIKTESLKPDGIDRSVLLAISLIVLSLSLGSILWKIFKRRSQKDN